MVVPIIMFVLIMFSAQMILSAISNEKIDKTLETLLSAPVSRLSVLASKMLAAGVVAALQVVVYMFGMSKMTGGLTEGMGDTSAYESAMEKPWSYYERRTVCSCGNTDVCVYPYLIVTSMVLGNLQKTQNLPRQCFAYNLLRNDTISSAGS